MSPQKLLTVPEGLHLVLSHIRPTGSERVALAEATARVLAEDVTCDMDMPPFNKSAMDGYACRRADIGDTPLTITETVAAGQTPTRRIAPGECISIMTGAPVPEGADCVIPVENTERVGPDSVRIADAGTRDNICPRGEDIRRGDTVLPRGTRLAPQHIGVLATAGCAAPLVARRPRVAVLTTGNEIVEPCTVPSKAQIRNSNGPQICAQIQRAGGEAHYCGIAPDTEKGLDSAVKAAVANADVLLASGGVSMGEFDLVPHVLRSNGFTLVFEKLAVKPGMPTVFGVSADTLCFGLPGNPVSTFVLFELLVRPLIMAMMGDTGPTPAHRSALHDAIRKRRADRDTWIPVRTITPGLVAAVDYHGSGHLNALATADGLICLPAGQCELEKGTLVDVRPI